MGEFTRGSQVVVLRGEHRGKTGAVNEIRNISGGLVDLGLFLDGDTNIQYNIPSEDCKLLDDNSFNAQDYLTKEEMHTVLLRIFTEKASAFVDEVLRNRSVYGIGSLTDQVLAAIAKKYIDENFESMTPYVLERFKTVIESSEPLIKDEDSKSFAASIQWNLESAAGKYIEENKETIWALMDESIKEAAKQMSMDQYIKIISEKMGRQFKKELESFVNKDSKE